MTLKNFHSNPRVIDDKQCRSDEKAACISCLYVEASYIIYTRYNYNAKPTVMPPKLHPNPNFHLKPHRIIVFNCRDYTAHKLEKYNQISTY